MSVQFRNNVHIAGAGHATMVFAHGLGCDQSMWRLLAPAYQDRFRTVLYDLTGSGASDRAAYDRTRHGSLHGHADDLLDILEACSAGPVVFVGHSVSATIGLLAANKAPERFVAQVMVGPSPCYLNDGDYIGGFNLDDLESMLASMDDDFPAWTRRMAPVLMGASRAELTAELVDTFMRNDQGIARHFARATFLSDHRADLLHSTVPSLILQCSDDLIVPREVGDYMLRHMPNSSLRVIDDQGHCPHVSASTATSRAIDVFLHRTLG
ncbi:Sigma factor SigB regulation protein RsbQ [Massilia sp. Bi118]|uniref:alpha/beta fold hydrolase n=1 Tax=Massilia sp. Bi118 TaxID=2822346 RepID=UPI001D6A3BB6|nr:alpha/beta hydrolase [Massilia sp. Bi118]CAH0238008.1 Sigma factor SigB regulation protein RsbQ [Massilia sp. Bi118]